MGDLYEITEMDVVMNKYDETSYRCIRGGVLCM